jgi:hypothetical protein
MGNLNSRRPAANPVTCRIRLNGANKLQERRNVDKAERKQTYLLKAQQAEHEAAKTKDADARASWLRIAASYRQLAEQT